MKNPPIVRKLYAEGYKAIRMNHRPDKIQLPYYVSDTNNMFVQFAGNFIQVEAIDSITDNRTYLRPMDERTVFIADDVKVYSEDGFEYEQ